MLLVQYNDNILAVFGFPLVIPHQKGGGRRKEQQREHIVTSKVWLFLSFFSPLVLPCQGWCQLQSRLLSVFSCKST